MKFIKLSTITLLVFSCNIAIAENIIRATAPIKHISPSSNESWLSYPPLVSEWTASQDVYECASISPDANLYGPSTTINQTYSGCKQDETRSIQPQQISEASQEIRAFGDPSTETRTIENISGTRSVAGTLIVPNIRYAISPGRVSGLGAGYHKQTTGSYNYGTSMGKTANSNQMFFSATYYNSQYVLNVFVATTATLNSSGTNYNVDGISPFVRPYKGVRLLKSNGDVLVEHIFKWDISRFNYFNRSLPITSTEYNFIYNNILLVTAIELFQ